MSYFDDFDMAGKPKVKKTFFDEFDAPEQKPAQQQTEEVETNNGFSPTTDAAIGFIKGTVDTPKYIAKAGLLVMDAVAAAGQKASSVLTGAPVEKPLPSDTVNSMIDTAGKAADAIGVSKVARPSQWSPMLDEQYSQEKKQADLEISRRSNEAEKAVELEGGGKIRQMVAGAKAALGATADNPAAVMPMITENIPQLFFGSGITKSLLRTTVSDLSAKVAVGTITKEAADQIIKRRATGISSAFEGVLTTGQVESQISETDPNADVLHRLAAIPAGIISTSISRLASKIPGMENVEGKLATRGAVDATESRTLGGLKGMVSEGILQEPWQEGQEQIWQNIGTGTEWQKGVGQSVVQGAIAGGPMGGVGGAISGGKVKDNSAEKVAQGTVEKIKGAGLSPRELVALRESPDALNRIGITPDHINNILKEHHPDSVEIANFESLLANAPSKALKDGLLATQRGKAYEKLVKATEQTKAQPAELDLDSAIVQVATRRSELAEKVDLTDDEAKELKKLNKVDYTNPSSLSDVLGVTIKDSAKAKKLPYDIKAIEVATEGVKKLDAFQKREALLEQWKTLQETAEDSRDENFIPQVQALETQIDSLSNTIKNTAQYRNWFTLFNAAREAEAKASTPSTEATTAQPTEATNELQEGQTEEVVLTEVVPTVVVPTVEPAAVEPAPATEVAPTPTTAPATEVAPTPTTAPATEVAPTPTTAPATEVAPTPIIEGEQNVSQTEAVSDKGVLDELPGQTPRTSTPRLLQTKAQKRIDVLSAKAKLKTIKPSEVTELKALRAAKKSNKKLAEHYQVQLVTEDEYKAAKAAKAPKAKAPKAEAPKAEAPVAEAPVAEAPVAEAPVTETPATEAPVEQKVVKIERAKDSETNGFTPEQKAQFIAVKVKENKYLKALKDANAAGDAILINTYQALLKQTRDEIDRFKSVHAKSVEKKTNSSRVDQADSKSVQNENIQLENNYILDKDGKPLLLYHGTSSKLSEFKGPLFTTTVKEGAQWYAEEKSDDQKGHIHGVNVRANKILDITEDTSALEVIAKEAGIEIEGTGKEGDFYAPEVSKHSPYEGTNVLDLLYIPKVQQALKNAGYDVVRAMDMLERSEIDTYIVLDPVNAIKPEDVKFSGNQETTGSSIEEIAGALTREFNEDFGKLVELGEARQPGGLVIRQTLSEALDYLGADLAEAEVLSLDGSTIQGLHSAKQNLSVIVADNTSAGMAKGVLVHEVGVHGMPDAALDNQALNLLEQHKNTKFMKAVIEKLQDAGAMEDANEVRAYIIEEAINTSGHTELDSAFWKWANWNLPRGVVDFLRNFVTQVKQAFVNLGIVPPTILSVNDLVSIARGAVKLYSKTTSGQEKLSQSMLGIHANLPQYVRDAYREAMYLRNQGMSVTEVLERTGWWEFVENQWTYELDDSHSKLSDVHLKAFAKAGNGAWANTIAGDLYSVFEHDALFVAYPELADINVIITVDPKRSSHEDQGEYIWQHSEYPNGQIGVKVSNVNSVKGILLHEIQHAIQERENFAVGGSPKAAFVEKIAFGVIKHKLTVLQQAAEALQELKAFEGIVDKVVDHISADNYDRVNETLEQAQKIYEMRLREVYGNNIPAGIDGTLEKIKNLRVPSTFEVYQRLAGEVESRLVAFREENGYNMSVEDALTEMLQEEGLLDQGMHYSDAIVIANAFDARNASINDAAKVVTSSSNQVENLSKTSWFENQDGIITQDGKSPVIEDAISFSKAKRSKKISAQDKEAVKVLEKIYGAKGKSLDNAIHESIEELTKQASNPFARTFYELTKSLAGGFKRDKNHQNSTWFDRVFGSPEFYFYKTHATREMLQAAIDDSDIRYQSQHMILGDFLDKANTLLKKFPAMYKAGAKYLVDTDRTGIGFSMRLNEVGNWEVRNRKNETISEHTDEKTAQDAMLQAEQDWMASRLIAKPVREFVLSARQLTNRAFDVLAADMRKQMTRSAEEGLPEPKSIFINDDGKQEQVALSELIAIMGDLRGTYFPRERVSRDFHLVAEQDGLPSILETFDWQFVENEMGNNKVELMKRTFNNLSPAGIRHRELIKLGYKPENIKIKPVAEPSEMLFDLPGTLAALDSLLTEASDKVKEEDMEAADKKLLAAADRALALRIADIYKAKGNMSSRLARSEKYFEGFETDPIRALTGYASRIATGVAKRTTARRMLQAFTGRMLTFKQFKNAFGQDKTYSNYIKWVKTQKVHPSKQKKLYEDGRQYMQYFLAPASGAERLVGYLKAATVLKYLGFRIGSAAINATSMLISVPATIAGHTGASLTKVALSLSRAMRVFAAFKHNTLLAKGHKYLGRPMRISEEDMGIMNTIYNNGWAVAQFNHDAAQAMTGVVGNAANSVMEKAMYLFGKVEEMNRAITIFAAYDTLSKNGLTRGDTNNKNLTTGTKLTLAKHASDRAHGIYGKAAKPWMVQKYRFLDAAYTFQKYQHSYHLNMIDLFGKYKSKKAVAFLALMPQLLAGTSTVAAIGLAIASALGVDDPQESYESLLAKVFGKSDFAKNLTSYGVIGAVFGLNLKGSLETKVPIPADLTELFGAPQSVLTDLYEGGKAIVDGEYFKGLEKLMPAAIAGPLKGYREMTEGVTKSNYAPVFYEGMPLKGTGADFARRFISFNPTRVSDIRNREWREEEVRRSYKADREAISKLYNRLLIQSRPETDPDWADFWKSVQVYNDKVARAPGKYMLKPIDLDWIAQQQNRNFKPNKYSKYKED